MGFFTSRTFRATAVFIAASFLFGCNIVKKESKTPTLLRTEKATQADLMREVNRFASVASLRAKMDLKFEDNSFAEFGMKEAYRAADSELVVQRPGQILLKVQAPFIRSDIAQMTSDGKNFRVAILNDGGSGKYKKFVKGTNDADYSALQRNLEVDPVKNGDAKAARENVSALSNLRPQHFTDAMLVRPTDVTHQYAMSTIFETEDDQTVNSKSPIRRVVRGYYLLDEFTRSDDGNSKIVRRFWFDRVGGIRLARQQIFGADGEIDSDIVYGREGKLSQGESLVSLPLEIQVTRPKEKYAIKLSYQSPESVMIGNKFPEAAFVLPNSWNLEEVDLDKRLSEAKIDGSPIASPRAVNQRDQ